MKYILYNLVLPDGVRTLKIGNYTINQLPEYKDNTKKLMWLVNIANMHGEIKMRTGGHQPTATTEECGDKSILKENASGIEDICLLLTLFTGRNVFALDEEISAQNLPIIADPRLNHYGGVLRCSLGYIAEHFDEETGNIIPQEAIPTYEGLWDVRDIGFGKLINEVLVLISSREWQEKYKGGYFLFLMNLAMRRMSIEPTFLLCWTIWEHIYAVLNPDALSDSQLERVSGKKKITYILESIFALSLVDASNAEIKRIKDARNRLVHYGKKPDNVDLAEMDLFIRMTEYLICKVLSLAPSNLFNTSEKLHAFLKLGEE